MNKLSTSSIHTRSHQFTGAEVLLKPGNQSQQSDKDTFPKEIKGNFPSTQAGIDLTQIPVHPALHANQQIQCCAKDGAGCSCPKCREAADNDNGTADEQQETPEPQSEQNPEQTPATAESSETQQNETESSQEQTPSTLVVEDSVTDLSGGQMRKTEFLQKLRSSICDTIGPVLATVGQTTEGCPYLNYWLDLYQGKGAADIERTAKKYAPDVAGATTAEEYISIITQRALRAAEIWARTGKLSGVPEGLPTTLPGGSQTENNKEENPVQAKAKSGGVKKADTPGAIKNELGSGQPLSAGVRSRMESAFGTSFSHVRTHTDSTASDLSSKVNARAFTVGNHVAFGNGEYHPGTLLGDSLIAHELAHTIQQNGAENSVDKMETGGERYNQLEADADKSAMGAVTSLWSGSKTLINSIKNSMPALRSGLKIQRCKTVNEGANPCTTRAAPPTPVKTMTVRPTYLWGGSTSAKFTSQLTYANNSYKMAGLDIKAGNAETVNETDTKAILGTNAMLNVSGNPPQKSSYTAEEKALLAKNTAANEVSLYYINKMENLPEAWALTYLDSDAIVEETTTTDRVLGHEIGHLIGGGGHPSNLDNVVAKSTEATGVDCVSDDQIEAARKSHLAK